MRLDAEECRERFGAAGHAVLAVNDPAAAPLVVPITFAIPAPDVVVSAVDFKPKSTTQLRRLRLLTENPACSLLVEHYEPDWRRLWWVRADGRAEVFAPDSDPRDPSATAAAVGALIAKYPQYAGQAPEGAVIRIAVDRWSGWSWV
jgi:PPOX class probable F420-dependent enzyme